MELEINGLATYDRKVVKYDLARLRALHEAVYRSAEEGASVRREAVASTSTALSCWSGRCDQPARASPATPKQLRGTTLTR